jgi:hypothetical protein
MRGSRIVLGVGVLACAAVAVGIVVSSANPVVCSAIGYVPVVVVDTAGVDEVADVRVCLRDACDLALPGRSSYSAAEVTPSATQPDPREPLNASRPDESEPDHWTVFTEGQPRTARVIALDAEGRTLADATTRLHWVRVGGTEQCGGPMQARVVLPG